MVQNLHISCFVVKFRFVFLTRFLEVGFKKMTKNRAGLLGTKNRRFFQNPVFSILQTLSRSTCFFVFLKNVFFRDSYIFGKCIFRDFSCFFNRFWKVRGRKKYHFWCYVHYMCWADHFLIKTQQKIDEVCRKTVIFQVWKHLMVQKRHIQCFYI